MEAWKREIREKYVLAIDSFKGCLTSMEAEDAAEEGVLSVRPNSVIVKVPVSDGGEGMLDVYASIMPLKRIEIEVHDPIMRLINAEYGISADGKTAIIETARACGLARLAPSERNPLMTTSYGVGELILDAIRKGCRDFVIGLGGSATSDAGIGMMQALGAVFLDADGNTLGQGGGVMERMNGIDLSNCVLFVKGEDDNRYLVNECHFTIASDVDNPLYGEDGAAYVFAPQKGADDNMVECLDKGYRQLATVMRAIQKTIDEKVEVKPFPILRDYSEEPGSGAAGGMGYAIQTFMDGKLVSGIQLILETIGFDKMLSGAKYVITGEGKADRQTLMGKLPMGILSHASEKNVPVILIAGDVEDSASLVSAGFTRVVSINDEGEDTSDDPDQAKENIIRAMQRIIG